MERYAARGLRRLPSTVKGTTFAKSFGQRLETNLPSVSKFLFKLLQEISGREDYLKQKQSLEATTIRRDLSQ